MINDGSEADGCDKGMCVSWRIFCDGGKEFTASTFDDDNVPGNTYCKPIPMNFGEGTRDCPDAIA
jgi:hypothetical protein